MKLGGDNVGRYVAPHYAEQVESVRAAGLIVGHYWVPGKQDPIGAADFMADHLHEFDAKRDFLVLDNETLDRGMLYADAEAARFVSRLISRLELERGQVKVYIGAADLRARQWPKLNALLPNGPIVASYGRNTGKRDHEPNLGGRFGGRWEGHQYTSQGRVAGFTVDRNVFKAAAFDYVKGGKPTPAKGGSSSPAPTPGLEPTIAQGKALQTLAREAGYEGPIDGKLGVQSWSGVQRFLAKGYGYEGDVDGVPGPLTYAALQRFAAKHGGYEGPVDGDPGSKTWAGAAKAAKSETADEKPAPAKAPAKPKPEKADDDDSLAEVRLHAGKALQTWARRGGYHGPIDGILGEKSWTAIQTLLARSYGYTGKVDGVPGKLTYQALQRLAKKGGYTGPVDGELGINSYRGVAKALGA